MYDLSDSSGGGSPLVYSGNITVPSDQQLLLKAAVANTLTDQASTPEAAIAGSIGGVAQHFQIVNATLFAEVHGEDVRQVPGGPKGEQCTYGACRGPLTPGAHDEARAVLTVLVCIMEHGDALDARLGTACRYNSMLPGENG